MLPIMAPAVSKRPRAAVATVYDAFTKEPAREDSERVHIILREQGKEAAR